MPLPSNQHEAVGAQAELGAEIAGMAAFLP